MIQCDLEFGAEYVIEPPNPEAFMWRPQSHSLHVTLKVVNFKLRGCESFR